MTKFNNRLLFLLLAWWGIQTHAYAAIGALWANDGEDKVTRDDLRATNKPASAINSIWDGTTIKLFGARNEVVNFNLILEAPQGAANVSVSLNTLTDSGGHSISSIAATGDQVFSYVNRNIELFYIRYLQINGLSLVSYGTYDERHIPKRLERPWSGQGNGSGSWTDRPDHNKFYPDIAVPLELVPSFNIASGQNQSIWGDIYIPKTIPPGVYSGSITIKESGTVTHRVPIQLTVRNFTLPDTPSSKTMLFYSSDNVNTRYLGSSWIDPNTAAGAQGKQIRDRHFMVAHRHKISLIGDNTADCNNTSDQPCPEWNARLTGSLFTSANGYDGPGVNVGNNVYSIGTYGSWNWQSGGQSAMNQHTNAWANWFSQNAPGIEYFLYLIDESSNFAQTQMWAQWIATNPGPGQNVRSMATIDLPDAASQCPSLDFPTSTLSVGVPSAWQPLDDLYTTDTRKRFYMYNGHRPATGSFGTDDDGVALRELAWAQYKKHVNRWFFWESTYYNNYQGGMGQTDVFQSAQTFGTSSNFDSVLGQTGWNYSNGDGVLFYPGTDQLFPNESYGVHGPFASLRLKYWRRGIQDVDYLTMAEAINPVAVQNLVNSMVPLALWEYGVSDPNDPTWVRSDISWSIDPNVWEAARAQLADIIAAPPGPQMALQISADKTSIVSGDTVTYTMQYQNSGGQNAVNVSLVDAVPTGTAVLAASTAGASLSGTTLTWNLGVVSAGSTGTVTYQVVVSSTSTNAASVTYQDGSGNTVTAQSNSVTVTVPGTIASTLLAPVIDGFNPFNYYLSAGDSLSVKLGGGPATALQWSFTPGTSPNNAQWPQIAAAQGVGSAILTASPSLSLSAASWLTAGLWHVQVTAINAAGSSAPASADFALVLSDLAHMRVFPNPWRADRDQSTPYVTFDNMSTGTTVKIFSISGHLVKTLDASTGSARWLLDNDQGHGVASGLYIYLANGQQNQKMHGKIAIIR